MSNTRIPDITEGWTSPIPFQLRTRTGQLDFTGVVDLPILHLTGVDDSVVNTSGKIAWATISTGVVTFTPGAGDLLASKSPYRVKFEVEDGDEVAFFPQGAASLLTVWPVT